MQTSLELISHILSKYQILLGNDFEKYRNHVHRVYSLCLEFDGSKENELKYAIASVFHDLGIWTDKTFDYLAPSISLAHAYLTQSGNDSWREEIGLMIDMHHKRTKYIGDFEKTVEIFRKADWVDVSMGKILFGLPKTAYSEVSEKYPLLGFHKFLVVQTCKNFFKSPLNPLPMFKR